MKKNALRSPLGYGSGKALCSIEKILSRSSILALRRVRSVLGIGILNIRYSPQISLAGGPLLRLLMKDMKSGSIELEAEDSDDLWHLYNLIDRGDRVCGNTLREVKVSRGSGEERGGRKRVFFCIEVEDLDFQSFTERLRIKGRVISGPEEINIQGSYHSFAVEPHDRITITKDE